MACPLSGSHPQLSPLKIERGVAQDAAEQRPLFVKLRRPAVPGEDRRFTRMQRRQQRDNKQIAIFDAQRPALAFFITQRVDQLSDVVAQIAKRPEMVVLQATGVSSGRGALSHWLSGRGLSIVFHHPLSHQPLAGHQRAHQEIGNHPVPQRPQTDIGV